MNAPSSEPTPSADRRHSGPGALRSQVELSIQTHQAQLLVRGRREQEGKPPIIGLLRFATKLGPIWAGAANDDPYTDWWLVHRFRVSYPDAPAYLTRYADGTYTAYRWRRSSAKHWRSKEPAGTNVTLDLTSGAGLALLRTLPTVVQASWLDYERERVALNLELALVAYERARLRDYLARVKTLNRIGRHSETTAGDRFTYNPGI
jgi:hypothetical protein